MLLSIVVSVFNEEESLPFFFPALQQELDNLNTEWEVIFVNDGSTDKSEKIIRNFTQICLNVKLISFSRNFGHEAAMIAGIDTAQGEAIICMDSDMQHPPAQIKEMLRAYQEDTIDIITMVRKTSADTQLHSKLFYRLLNKLSVNKLDENASDFFLISKQIAELLRVNYRERIRFLRGIIQMVGFKKRTLIYDAPTRIAGKTKYSFSRLFSLSIVAIASLSTKPLQISIYMGCLSSLFSVLLGLFSIVMKFVDQPIPGYTTLIVFMSLMFGIQFILLGIVGMYIGFLFDEQKRRPLYIVANTINI